MSKYVNNMDFGKVGKGVGAVNCSYSYMIYYTACVALLGCGPCANLQFEFGRACLSLNP